MSFLFWQRWLVTSCFVFGCVGIAVAVAGESAVFEGWNGGVRDVFADGRELGPEAVEVKNFLLGPLGATILGSYVLCGFIAAGPFARQERWAWMALTTRLLTWFVLDSAVSIHSGAYFNVYLINLVTLFGQAIPLAMTAPAFFRPRDPGH